VIHRGPAGVSDSGAGAESEIHPVVSDPLIMAFLLRGLTPVEVLSAEGQTLITVRLNELRAHIDLLLALQALAAAAPAESDDGA
jgi:hypothetical protein